MNKLQVGDKLTAVPSLVTVSKPSGKKSVFYKGLYFVFKNKKEYPLELLIASMPEASEFDLAFIKFQNNDGEVFYYGVWVTLERKTIMIIEDFIGEHLLRYALLHNVVYLSNESGILPVFDVVKVLSYKIPELMEPNDARLAFRQVGIVALLGFIFFIGIGIFNDKVLALIESEQVRLSVTMREANSSTPKNVPLRLSYSPSSLVSTSGVFIIKDGVIKWQ